MAKLSRHGTLGHHWHFALPLRLDWCLNRDMSITTLTPKQLRQAANLQEKIASLKAELASIFGLETKAAPVQKAKPAKRKLSASHLAKIRAAQKLRWAKVKAAKAKIAPVKAVVKVSAKPVTKKKGGMSAAGRARIVAAQKARWAKIKAAKTASKAAVKPVAVKAAVKSGAKTVKRVISPEARAKMAAAAKAMWVARKAAKK
jgi:hypothetical protein